jgi:hypothetical protein
VALEVTVQEIEFTIVQEKAPPASGGTNSSRTSGPAAQQPAPTRPNAANLNLDEIELEIRYRMFRRQFDLGEDFKVSRVSDRIIVAGTASSAERATDIRSLLNSLPGVRVSITTPDHRSSVPAVVSPQTKPAALTSSVPVLKTSLEDQFDSEEERREFVDRCLTASDDALSHAWALRNLAERYTAQSERLLAVSSRTRLHEMLSAHADRVRQYIGQLQPLLPMLPSGPVAKVEPPSDWNATALSIFEKVQEQDSLVGALLAGTEVPGQNKEAVPERFRFTYNSIGVLLDRLETRIR